MSKWLINPSTNKWQIPNTSGKWQIGNTTDKCCCKRVTNCACGGTIGVAYVIATYRGMTGAAAGLNGTFHLPLKSTHTGADADGTSCVYHDLATANGSGPGVGVLFQHLPGFTNALTVSTNDAAGNGPFFHYTTGGLWTGITQFCQGVTFANLPNDVTQFGGTADVTYFFQ